MTGSPDRRIGQLQHQRARQASLREKLLSRYKKNGRFGSAFAALAVKHRTTLLKEKELQLENGPLQRADWEVQQIGAVAIAFGELIWFSQAARWRNAIQVRTEDLARRWRDHREGSRVYFEELEAFTYDWGLRCEWAPEILHRSLMTYLLAVDVRPDLPMLFVDWDKLTIASPVGTIKLRAYYDPIHHDWESVEGVILREARRQRDEIRAELAQQDFVVIDTEPALDRHIHWLYLRICPQPDIGRPWGEDMIAKREGTSRRTVRDAIESLTCELGLTLPPLPPGKPRRS